MKRVLITGANSYLGDNVKAYLEKQGNYSVDILDMLDDQWKSFSFTGYDVVFNVCAIVHRFDKVDDSLYYKVNRDLAVEIAEKAKQEGVKQFIQTSTNGVFGLDVGVMSEKKGFRPKTPYEKSKYEADCLLEKLRDNSFKVCIIRPPLMYGKGCKGNFPKLEHYATTRKVFPSLINKKDFIYIENIADFVAFAIENALDETCYPRDVETTAVSAMIKTIAELNNNRIRLCWLFNPFVKMFYRLSHPLKLVFGNCYCVEPICSRQWIPPYTMKQALIKMYEVIR